MLKTLVQRTQTLPADQLAEHVFSTYASIRYGMAVIAFAFPIILVGLGWFAKVPFQCSMSAYYWAGRVACAPDVADMIYPPMRIWFVGILFIVGAFLYLYKGFTALENYALNAAGMFALGVALFPMPWGRSAGPVTLHGTCAVLLFLCIAYVSIFRAMDTLILVPDASDKTWYRRRYRIVGLFMVLSPATAFIVGALLTGGDTHFVFFAEAAGIYAFGLYWLFKSRELAQTNAELHAVHRTLSATPQGVIYLTGPLPSMPAPGGTRAPASASSSSPPSGNTRS